MNETTNSDISGLFTPEELMYEGLLPEDLLLEDPDFEETLVYADRPQSESKPEVNAQTSYVGVNPTLILLDCCSTQVCAPSVLRITAAKVACGSMRQDLQKATLAHIESRQSGNVRAQRLLERRIASLRSDLASLDPRVDPRMNPSKRPLGLLARILAKVGFGPTL